MYKIFLSLKVNTLIYLGRKQQLNRILKLILEKVNDKKVMSDDNYVLITVLTIINAKLRKCCQFNRKCS